ncbi:MAG: hypothetical protein ACT4PI_11875 [Actinomycetota bacterium]
MSARRLAWALGVGTLAYSGAYVFIYLYRWEWNRTLTAGLFFLAAEIALAAAVIVERIRKLEQRLDARPDARPDPNDPAYAQVRARLKETAPPARDHFAWLRSSMQRTNVFIPVLMGAGVILSALAWLVEKVARATAGRARDDKLAQRLLPISLPAEPIVRDDTSVNSGLALLLRPTDGAHR